MVIPPDLLGREDRTHGKVVAQVCRPEFPVQRGGSRRGLVERPRGDSLVREQALKGRFRRNHPLTEPARLNRHLSKVGLCPAPLLMVEPEWLDTLQDVQGTRIAVQFSRQRKAHAPSCSEVRDLPI